MSPWRASKCHLNSSKLKEPRTLDVNSGAGQTRRDMASGMRGYWDTGTLRQSLPASEGIFDLELFPRVHQTPSAFTYLKR